jgi:hypothetical protein
MSFKHFYEKTELYFKVHDFQYVYSPIIDFLSLVGNDGFPVIRAFNGLFRNNGPCWKIENVNKQAVLKGLK